MSSYDIVFYLLALLSLICAIGTVTSSSPIYSAFFLVLTMVNVACMFVLMEAYFLAGVQLIVYAGAVVVLFVMVLMLFNLHQEKETFSRGNISGMAKLASAGLLCGILATTLYHFSGRTIPAAKNIVGEDQTEKLAKLLFTDFIFGFEAISVLILVVAVGAVSLSQFRGGTHAKH